MLVARLAGHTYVAVRAVAPGTVDRLMNPFLTALLILVTGVPFVAFLVLVPRRVLGLQIGLVRTVIAAIVGNVVWFAAGVSLQTGNEPITSALVTFRSDWRWSGRWRFSPPPKWSSPADPDCGS